MITEHRRNSYLLAGLLMTTAAGGLVATGDGWHLAPGPPTPGHDSLSCDDCHRPASGTTRQQLQALVRYAVGTRRTPPQLGTVEVGSRPCEKCHQRPMDVHPLHRFQEPRFRTARANLQADECLGCHLEHLGVRVARDGAFCGECHGSTMIKDDPTEPSHETLVSTQRWDTCLQCHDFHGNHDHKPPERLVTANAASVVVAHLGDGDREAAYGPVLHDAAPSDEP